MTLARLLERELIMFRLSRLGCVTFVCLTAGWMQSDWVTATSGEVAQALPPDVVSAWQEAGASVGWLGPVREGSVWQFHPSAATLDAASSLPALKLHGWREGLLARVPPPSQRFGLDSELHRRDG